MDSKDKVKNPHLEFALEKFRRQQAQREAFFKGPEAKAAARARARYTGRSESDHGTITRDETTGIAKISDHQVGTEPDEYDYDWEEE